LFRARIRAWLAGSSGDLRPGSTATVGEIAVSRQAPPDAAPFDHNSRGLQQFIQALPDQAGLSILDLGDINQANVAFVTGLGHRHCFEDLLAAHDAALGVDMEPNGLEEPSPEQEAKTREFLDGLLKFSENQFDGVLVWDTLQFLPEPIAEAVLERLFQIVRPGGVLLAVFHAEVRQAALTVHSYRILDHRTLRLIPKGSRPPAQAFNNRSLEKLFENCRSLKFFLTRDRLKEVIVRR